MSENGEIARYLCRVIDDGHTSAGLRWKGVIGAISFALGSSEDDIGRALLSLEIGYNGSIESDFLVHGIYDAEVTSEQREAAFEKILENIGKDNSLTSILIMVSTEYSLTLDLVDFLLQDDKMSPPGLVDNPYVAIATSDLFLESKSVNSFIKRETEKLADRIEEVIKLTDQGWFLNLLEILRSGSHERGQPITTAFHGGSSSGLGQKVLYGIVNNGLLPWLMLYRGRVMKEKAVIEAFRRKRQADSREGNIRKLYYWIGIANDFVLGVLFLVGSIEFLPNGNEVAGVVMFIVGSAQLVARSIIKIAMNIHVKSNRKKHQRNPD